MRALAFLYSMNFIMDMIARVGGYCVAVSMLLMLYLFRPFMGSVSRSLQLKRIAPYWPTIQKYTRLSTLLETIGFITFWGSAIAAYNHFPRMYHGAMDWPLATTIILCGFAGLALWNICIDLDAHARSPDVLSASAGARAEKEVRKIIKSIEKQNPGSQSLHNALFVFNKDTPAEFSSEADHILITEHQVFLIETKYKSGTIMVGAEAPKWQVKSAHGESSMRNALKQVKNTARVLQKQISLPCEIVPLVAIYGNDVQLVGAPANVVLPDDLWEAVFAFNTAAKHRIVDTSAIGQLLASHTVSDKASRARHNERANAAAAKARMEDIVSGSSLQ